MTQLASKSTSRGVGGRSRALDVDRYVSLRIRQRRIMLGLTQQQMAELIGVTYQQAHKYETGINRISAGRLYQIARALGVEISYFFEDVEPGSGVSPQPGADAAAAHAARARAQLRRDQEPQAPGGALPSGARAGRRRGAPLAPTEDVATDRVLRSVCRARARSRVVASPARRSWQPESGQSTTTPIEGRDFAVLAIRSRGWSWTGVSGTRAARARA